jgi:uncharacterized DUF497 family protein
MSRLHDSFEWDEDKAGKNLKNHGVSFDDATLVLADQDGDIYQIEGFDALHSDDEDRFTTTASHPNDRRIVLRITWTDRSAGGERITRIISARLATKRERKSYAQEIGNK